MPRRLSATVSALAVAAALGACSGGDSSPEDAAGGGVPPQSDVSPRTNIGQSEGFPDADSGQEALVDEGDTDQGAPGS